MGYTTDFAGQFTVTPPLRKNHQLYLEAFSDTRHMRRDPELIEDLPDEVRWNVGLPVGLNGDYFVADPRGHIGVDRNAGDHNNPPDGVPGLWCQWTPTEHGDGIEWNGSEKFYDYTEWLRYLVEHFLTPWGYSLDGTVSYAGEEPEDTGVIYAKGGKVARVPDERSNPGPPAGWDD